MNTYLLIIVIICALVSTLYTILHYKTKLHRERTKLSIKESLELTSIPVITLYNDNKPFNFLLDTGSSESHIRSDIADKINGEVHDCAYSYIGSSGGDADASGILETNLCHKGISFKATLIVNSNLNEAFDEVEKTRGVHIDGLLGSDFFKRHRYILDFAELVAYYK